MASDENETNKDGRLNKNTVRLSDFQGQEISKPPTSKSIYMGADIKLEAFDCFHNVLNKCVHDFTFSIADAALILKQSTPDIIKKIFPLITQINSPKKKTSEECDENAMDLEVSELTDEKKEKREGTVRRKVNIKRPDASRPTRMLSPGSNSCSPVSAAVQALISISAPVVESKNTETVVQANQSQSSSSTTVSHQRQVARKEINDGGSVFIPVSKPSVSSEFVNSLLTPVPKPASTSSVLVKDLISTTTTSTTEFPEVLVVSRINEESQGFILSSSLLDSISTQSGIMPDSSTISSFLSHGLMSTNAMRMASDQILQAKQEDIMQQTMNKSLHTDDPLPNFNLFSNTSLVNDLSCGLPSPFHNPGSPIIGNSLQQQQQNLQKQQFVQKQLHMQRSQFIHDQQRSIEQPQISLPTTPSLVQTFKNVKTTHETTNSIENPLLTVRTESSHNSYQPVSTLVHLRTILPKPFETTPSSLSIVPVIPAIVSTNASSQLSPMIKLDEKKSAQYSVPPSQIFTKLNANQLPNLTLPPLTSTGCPTKPVLANAFFPSQNTESINQQQQYSQKDLKQILSAGETNISSANPTDLKLKQQAISSFPREKNMNTANTTIVKNTENTGGNLEVASALLSMGSDGSEDVSKTTLDDFKKIRDCVENSLKSVMLPVVFGENGSFKLDEVVIDPRKHRIEKGHFECGSCNHVFTSVLYLARHIKRVCPDMSQRKWKCECCSKAFRHPFGLQQHMFTHTGERPHKCQHCPKAFYSANDLRRHVRTHSGEKPYECRYCQKRFSTTISLRTHTYIHTGERPHKCSQCSKTFATSSKLSRHVVTHSDKRPFPCDQCSKTFNRSGDLRRHYSTHHGETHGLLSCDQCNKGFATEKALNSHKQTHTKRDQLQQVVDNQQQQQWVHNTETFTYNNDMPHVTPEPIKK